MWAEVLKPFKGTEILAEYRDQFYSNETAVTRRKTGKGSVIYIGLTTDDGKMEKSIVRKAYKELNDKILDLPEGVFVYSRKGLNIAVNYSSENYKLNNQPGTKYLSGNDMLSPAGVSVWK